MTYKILVGDVIDKLKDVESESIQCCVTSPPYFGLRDYGVDGQIGLEETPEAYVQKMVEVFREVRRVLKDDGIMWLNIGDTYSGGGRGSGYSDKQDSNIGTVNMPRSSVPDGCKPKDLIGIPWMVAFALRSDGWFLRQDIIWHKPNPMPESVTDRCTKSHEYIFLMSKSAKYYYNADAVKEPFSTDNNSHRTDGNSKYSFLIGGGSHSGGIGYGDGGRNKRSVWSITTKGYSGAHFATFPPEIPRLCILAGSKEGDMILDPFAGSGTTGEVALRYGRNFVGCELNEKYVKDLIIPRLDAVSSQELIQFGEAI